MPRPPTRGALCTLAVAALTLPLLGAIHTQGTHLRRRGSAGWFERGRSRLFVSRGMGESIPLRFGARPQVALITLLGPAEGRAA